MPAARVKLSSGVLDAACLSLTDLASALVLMLAGRTAFRLAWVALDRGQRDSDRTLLMP